MTVTLDAAGGPREPAPIPVISDIPIAVQDAVGVNAILLDGKAWPITGAVTWGFVSGTSPQALSIRMQKRFARNFASKANRGKGSLRIIINEATSGAGTVVNQRQNTVDFEALNLQLNLPDDYAHNVLTVEDDRYRWNKPKVFRDFNLTRKANDIVVFRNLPVSRQNLLREAAIYYRERTLKDDGTVWTALDIVKYALTEILGYDIKNLDFRKAAKSEYVPQNEVVDGEGAGSLIGRMLALDGNNLYIDEKGKVVVYDITQPFLESDFRKLFPRGGPVGRTAGAMHVMDYENLRPQSIESLVTPKIELLCTFRSVGAQTTTSDVPARSFEEAKRQMLNGQIFVDNVTRTVVDGQVNDENGAPLPRDSIVTIEKALEGFGSLYGINGITISDLLKFYGADAFLITGAALAPKGPAGAPGLIKLAIDPTAAVVKDAIEKDLRTLFRVPRFVIEQIRGMEALHADMLNEVTRTRAISSVFSTISWLVPSSVQLPEEMPDGVVLDSFTETDQVTGSKSRRSKYLPISGATITIEDEDLGLIRVNWGQDYDRPGAVKSVVPGEAVDDGYYIREDTNYSYNDRQSFSGTGIKEDWECSFVISVIPDLFRDKRRLYRETRTPPPMVKQNGQTVQVKGKGPQVQRRIRIEDARFTHGITPYELGPAIMTINPAARALGARGRFVNEAIITAIIDAETLRLYKTFNDQMEGAMTLFPGRRNIKIRPVASLQTILYTYAVNGEVSILLGARRNKTPANILSRLPADVLRATVRQLEPPAQGG